MLLIQARTTNGEISPVSDQHYEIWNYMNIQRKSKVVFIPNIHC